MAAAKRGECPSVSPTSTLEPFTSTYNTKAPTRPTEMAAAAAATAGKSPPDQGKKPDQGEKPARFGRRADGFGEYTTQSRRQQRSIAKARSRVSHEVC